MGDRDFILWTGTYPQPADRGIFLTMRAPGAVSVEELPIVINAYAPGSACLPEGVPLP